MKNFFTYFFKGKLFLPIVFQCGHRGKLALIYQYGEVKYGRKMGEHNFGQGGIRLKVIRGRYKANFYQGHFNTHFEILGHPDTPLNWFWYNLFTKRSCRCKTRANDFMVVSIEQLKIHVRQCNVYNKQYSYVSGLRLLSQLDQMKTHVNCGAQKNQGHQGCRWYLDGRSQKKVWMEW